MKTNVVIITEIADTKTVSDKIREIEKKGGRIVDIKFSTSESVSRGAYDNDNFNHSSSVCIIYEAQSWIEIETIEADEKEFKERKQQYNEKMKLILEKYEEYKKEKKCYIAQEGEDEQSAFVRSLKEYGFTDQEIEDLHNHWS